MRQGHGLTTYTITNDVLFEFDSDALTADAAATLAAGDAKAALCLLEEIAKDAETYQPWWATKLAVHAARTEWAEALAATDVAIQLTDDPAVETFLETEKRQIKRTMA